MDCALFLHLRQQSIGYMGDGFYRSKEPTNSIKVLKEIQRTNKKKQQNTHMDRQFRHKKVYIQNKHNKSPSLDQYGVTRGRLPQRAGLPGLNGSGAAATVPLKNYYVPQ